MKRNPSLFARLLVPVLLFLTLLPPAACLIFRQSALSYAYSEAESDLQALQQSILPLMTRHFSSDELSTQDKIRNFLRNVSAVIRKYDGSAKLLIYSSDMRMVYPSDEQERADRRQRGEKGAVDQVAGLNVFHGDSPFFTKLKPS